MNHALSAQICHDALKELWLQLADILEDGEADWRFGGHNSRVNVKLLSDSRGDQGQRLKESPVLVSS